jgi:[ribosomal protein S18]-alanine N-acetyltransferase
VPAGFALMRVAADEAEVIAIGVRPAQQRRGVGRVLLEEIVARAARAGAARLFLEVAEDNAPARALYAAAGFAQVGRRPNYYRRKEISVPALVLRFDVGSGSIGVQST